MSLNVNPENYKHWHYKNSLLLILSFFLLYLLAKDSFLQEKLSYVSSYGYFGAFLAGLFFVSIFTVVPAALVLFNLAESLDPLGLTISAAFGSIIGDYLLFKYLRDHIIQELMPVFKKMSETSFFHIFHTPFFSWLIPILGATIIASPLPDEAGISLMGLSRLKTWQFLLITFILNMLGIFIIIYLSI